MEAVRRTRLRVPTMKPEEVVNKASAHGSLTITILS